MDSDRRTLDGVLNVEIVAAPQYFIGLPIIISVSWNNDTTDATLFRIPDLDLTFSQGGRIGVSMVPKDGDGVPLDSGFARGEEEEEGLTIGPGTRRRMVCDLTNMGVVFHPGNYDLTLSLLRPAVYRSNTVSIRLAALDEADQREAKRLRNLAEESRVDTGAWRFFLEDLRRPLTDAPAMQPAAHEQLALHLFLHRAIATPRSLAQIDRSPLDRIHGAHLEAEVAALKYELLHARRDHHAAAFRSSMLARFPGLRHRAQAVDAGNGQLAAYRSYYGIGKRTFDSIGGPDYE